EEGAPSFLTSFLSEQCSSPIKLIPLQRYKSNIGYLAYDGSKNLHTKEQGILERVTPLISLLVYDDLVQERLEAVSLELMEKLHA
ncbi:MAG: hypothetical protein HQL32_06965, partial [Planctomycetes bacterium]|nr:hypothetical protein [Planctomycetota bacterium]